MTMTAPLLDHLRADPYRAYTYAYPHKTAYRPLDPPVPLREAWADEDRSALFLYVHIPFCEMRCGFCNLFTTVGAGEALERAYLQALKRQALRVRDALEDAAFSRIAVGGGTPTYLEAPELEGLFDLLARTFQAAPAALPTSVETSPATATPERLRVLRERGVQRVSIGVQSFVDAEVRGVGRAQRGAVVHGALEAIRAAGLPTLNIDLMYGLAHQTPETWLTSLRTALTYRPEELYLYPLYVRPLTGIGRTGRSWDDERLELYRLGRDHLRANGYVQVSMRMFRRADAPAEGGPAYRCQTDGMVGLGCGARSYTGSLHYSSEYAVGAQGVREILASYVRRAGADFDVAAHGIQLGEDERRRRHALQSLLQVEGLQRAEYAAQFGADVLAHLPQLRELTEVGLAVLDGTTLRLTDAGLELSDAIGPWLYSDAVRALSDGYAWR